MDEAQIAHMVDRFLAWHVLGDLTAPPRSGPSTRDLAAAQAMVRYMVEGLPEESRTSRPDPDPPWPIGRATDCKREGWRAFLGGMSRDAGPYSSSRPDLQAGWSEGWDAASRTSLSKLAAVEGEAETQSAMDLLHEPSGLVIRQMFRRCGLADPPRQLLDALVLHLNWARYGAAVAAALHPPPLPRPSTPRPPPPSTPTWG